MIDQSINFRNSGKIPWNLWRKIMKHDIFSWNSGEYVQNEQSREYSPKIYELMIRTTEKWIWNGVEVCKSCRCRKMLFLKLVRAKIFDDGHKAKEPPERAGTHRELGAKTTHSTIEGERSIFHWSATRGSSSLPPGAGVLRQAFLPTVRWPNISRRRRHQSRKLLL